MGGCGAYDANSLHLPVTCADAPESSIQREEVPFNIGARFEIPSSVCARFTKFSRTVVSPLCVGISTLFRLSQFFYLLEQLSHFLR
jgi:hypothetical protein